MSSIETFLGTLYKHAVQTHEQRYDENWKITLQKTFKAALGDFYYESEAAFQPVILEKTDMGTYERIRVEISTISSLRMPVYVLLPKVSNEKKLPTVLAIHGHGYGSKALVGLNFDGKKKKEEEYHKDFAIELVKRGVVVVAPELIGFGDRKLQEHQGVGKPTDNSCYRIASNLLLTGHTLPGLRVYECKRVIDYIESLEVVDAGKIGVIGISGGGLVASFTAALDERLKAAVISGYANTFHASIMDRRHCLDNYIPGILNYAEMPELIGLMVPRPLFIEAGTKDHLFPVAQVVEAVDKLKAIYHTFNVEELVSYHLFEGGHEISGEKSFGWLINQLR